MCARKMPIGIQDFAKLREDGFVYVDKTAIIYDLARTSSPYFFEPSAQVRKEPFDFNT